MLFLGMNQPQLSLSLEVVSLFILFILFISLFYFLVIYTCIYIYFIYCYLFSWQYTVFLLSCLSFHGVVVVEN